MVLLRSIPEFSSMCISAVDFLGDAMNCKGSVFNSINCDESSSWYDSRDEEIATSNPASHRLREEDQLSRHGDLLDTESLSSSIHLLLHDTSERYRQNSSKIDSTNTWCLSDDDIFRSRGELGETHSQCLSFCKLNRCAAWSQDDFNCYSFESEHLPVASKSKSDVRIVHWEDLVQDSLNVETSDIFRSKRARHEPGNQCINFCKLHRCGAWSVDESSSVAEVKLPCVKEEDNEPRQIHWDDVVTDLIRTGKLR